jgi:hypothetical protein
MPTPSAPQTRRRVLPPLFLMTVAFATTLAGDTAYTRAESDAMHRKVEQIVLGGRPAARRTRLTPVSEREVNAYIRHQLREQVPAGIAEPVITIVGNGRVTGRAMVDLDEVSRASRSTSWFDPMRLLSGRLPVTAQGMLSTSDGVGRFTLESATISGVPVPKSVLQQVVSYYSRSDEQPNGIGLDDPFQLPADIVEIRVEPGQAIVVQ